MHYQQQKIQGLCPMHLLQRLGPHTCTTLTNTKQYTETWTCAKCDAQATPSVTTPLALSTTKINPVRHTITPHPTMQDNSPPNSNSPSHTQRSSHTSTPTLNRAPRSTQTTQQTCTPSRTPAPTHTDPPQAHLLQSNQSPPPTLSLTLSFIALSFLATRIINT